MPLLFWLYVLGWLVVTVAAWVRGRSGPRENALIPLLALLWPVFVPVYVVAVWKGKQ